MLREIAFPEPFGFRAAVARVGLPAIGGLLVIAGYLKLSNRPGDSSPPLNLMEWRPIQELAATWEIALASVSGC